MKTKNTSWTVALLSLAFIVMLLVGEVKCIIKAVKCDWDPIGKAEVIYTASAFTGVGCIVGWIDIEDK
jgi:hypothetical protein